MKRGGGLLLAGGGCLTLTQLNSTLKNETRLEVGTITNLRSHRITGHEESSSRDSSEYAKQVVILARIYKVESGSCSSIESGVNENRGIITTREYA